MTTEQAVESVLRNCPNGFEITADGINNILQASRLPTLSAGEIFDMVSDLSDSYPELNIVVTVERLDEDNFKLKINKQKPMTKTYTYKTKTVTITSENPEEIVNLLSRLDEPIYVHFSISDDKFIDIESIPDGHLVNIIKNRVSRCKSADDLLDMLLNKRYVAELASRFEY